MVEQSKQGVEGMVIGLAGPGSLLIILIVALLIFGPKNLPKLGKAAGSTIREFKDATKGLADDNESGSKDKQGD